MSPPPYTVGQNQGAHYLNQINQWNLLISEQKLNEKMFEIQWYQLKSWYIDAIRLMVDKKFNRFLVRAVQRFALF